MLKFIDFLNLELQRPLPSGQDFIELSAVDAKRLNAVGQGNHIYLTISYPRANRHEVVKYVHGDDWKSQGGLVKVPVERGILGQRLSFATTSCVKADWNSVQLTELFQQLRNGG